MGTSTLPTAHRKPCEKKTPQLVYTRGEPSANDTHDFVVQNLEQKLRRDVFSGLKAHTSSLWCVRFSRKLLPFQELPSNFLLLVSTFGRPALLSTLVKRVTYT